MSAGNSALHTAMAVLAGGPYDAADIAGAMNRSLVMRSCRDDRVLLRVCKPLTAVDTTFAASFDDLKPRYVWGAHSQIGTARWSYLLDLNLDRPDTVLMTTLDPAAAAAATTTSSSEEAAVAGTGTGAGEEEEESSAQERAATTLRGATLLFQPPSAGWRMMAGLGLRGTSMCRLRRTTINTAKGAIPISAFTSTTTTTITPLLPQVARAAQHVSPSPLSLNCAISLWATPSGWWHLCCPVGGSFSARQTTLLPRLVDACKHGMRTSSLKRRLSHCSASPGERLLLALLPLNQRDSAIRVTCVAREDGGQRGAYSDEDIPVVVKCSKRKCVGKTSIFQNA